MTHDMAFAARPSSRIIVMREGEVAPMVRRREVFDDANEALLATTGLTFPALDSGIEASVRRGAPSSIGPCHRADEGEYSRHGAPVSRWDSLLPVTSRCGMVDGSSSLR